MIFVHSVRLGLLLLLLLLLRRSLPTDAFLPIARQHQLQTLLSGRSHHVTRVTRQQLLVLQATTRVRHPDRDVYHRNKLLPDEYDAIVIGSGIGGLTTAALLAQQPQNKGQQHKRVLVLEQHYVAGGCCHTFTRKGFEFATGIHYVGEMMDPNRGGNNDKAFDLSLKHLMDVVSEKRLVWDRMDDNYDTVYLGEKAEPFHIVAGEAAAKKTLVERFPAEKKAIDKYYHVIKRIRSGAMLSAVFKSLPRRLSSFLVKSRFYRLLHRSFRPATTCTVKQRLEELTENKDLQALLTYNYPDYGTPPDRAPFYMQALLASHYLDGAYYPRGGPSRIASSIIPTITERGGQVLVSAPVKRIVLDDATNTAIGVEMQDGQIIKSKVVISDAGFMNTMQRLLPPDLVDMDFSRDGAASKTQLHTSTTGLNLFVGLKGDAESLNLPKSNVWIYPSNDLSGEAQKIQNMTREEALALEPKELMVFVGFPSTKDSSWSARHPEKCTLEVITLAPYEWFEEFATTFDPKTKSHGPAYETTKTILAKKMWSRVVDVLKEANLPTTLEEVDHYEVGSPLTFGHYYNSQRGSWYGIDMDMQRFDPKTFFLRLRPEIPEVPHLYMTGQDVMMDGLIGASFGGLLCAGKVLGCVNPKSLLRTSSGSSDQDAASADNGHERGKSSEGVPVEPSTLLRPT